MGTVFIVSGKKETVDNISDLMLFSGFQHIDYSLSGSEARRRINLIEPELVIVNSPLPDESGIDLVLDISFRTESGILIIVRKDMYNEALYMLEKSRAMILGKPVDRAVLAQMAKFALTAGKSFKEVKNERDELKRHIEDRKTIERAKWILINKMGITEAEAHRYIQKKAMDSRKAQKLIAEEIIKNNEKNE